MRGKRIRFVPLLLGLVLLLGLLAGAQAASNEASAEALNELGLFRGTGTGYELDRSLSRAEAAVMLSRLLGREAEALACRTETPFGDVAGRWMEPYVAWAWSQGYAAGESDAAFAPNAPAGAELYLGYVLRALGYGDELSGGAAALAETLGLGSFGAGDFLRDDCVDVTCKALELNCKGSEETLLDRLVGLGAVKAPFQGPSFTVACVGDSLTEGLMTEDPAAQSYPSVMAGLTEGGIRFITENYGLSGACVDPDDSYLFALPYTGTAQYADSVKTGAEIVLLMLGTNDAFWSPHRDIFEDNFRDLLQVYLSLPQAPRVIVVLPPHIFLEMGGVDYNDNLAGLLDKEKAVARELGIPVIDAYSFNEGQSELFVDGIHFTVEGYALLARTIYTQLCEIVADGSQT